MARDVPRAVPDAVLDDPEAIERREQFWTAALTDERYSKNTTAVTTLDGRIVGVAMSGPALDDDATWESQLYVLYTYATVHGQGAGSDLLNSVIDPKSAAALWVATGGGTARANLTTEDDVVTMTPRLRE